MPNVGLDLWAEFLLARLAQRLAVQNAEVTKFQSSTVFNDFEANVYSVTIGFDVARDRIGEVFTHGAKVDSGMDRLLDDACVSLSLLLQHGVEPAALASSMGRLGDGKSPASIIGALADLIAREAQP